LAEALRRDCARFPSFVTRGAFVQKASLLPIRQTGSKAGIGRCAFPNPTMLRRCFILPPGTVPIKPLTVGKEPTRFFP
jgi:hypothetical protein